MFCQNCGKQLDEDMKFCNNCGARAAGTDADTRPQQPAQAQYTPPKERQYIPPKQPQYIPPMQYNTPRQQYVPQQGYVYPPAGPKKKTGLIVGLVIGAVALLSLIIVVVIIVNRGSVSIASAHIVSSAMATKVDAVTKKPLSITDTFSPDTPVVYATALISSAPRDTKITAKWTYVTDDNKFASVDVSTTSFRQYAAFSLARPNDGFPEGDYKVDIYINDKFSKTLEFSVE